LDIEAILAPFLPTSGLTGLQYEQVRSYLDLLLKWNQKTNLTAVRQPEEIISRHFGESFFLAAVLVETNLLRARPAASAGRLIDVGSGAGFPGIPVKIYIPGLAATLIESQNKKATFLKEVIRGLKLTDIEVFNRRAEEWGRSGSQGEIVTLRAVEQFEEVLPMAGKLVAPRGHLALLLGEKQMDSARKLLPSFAWQAPYPLPLSDSRMLLIGEAQR
jgi:16S rRNA (guanine527-N7)-methyltransferase